ncbi:hypothetical protein F5Y04DRAFT_242355 [Hypomontagnella monticulosa]|nr:hypothetical protein F5Y04DRAFT_242355 [Hypomontagnella monticulosa]
MKPRPSEVALPNPAIQPRDVMAGRRKRPGISRGVWPTLKLMSLVLIGLLSLVWFTQLQGSNARLLVSPSLTQAIRSEVGQPQASPTETRETPTVLECFQVAQPILTPSGPSSNVSNIADGSASKGACSVLLMEHVFAFSYGLPFVGNYSPPSCQFNRVIMNFTVVSQGRQFDRLALMYFGDIEVWRTSTAEPTQPPGISWTFLKDMTPYLHLWKSPQKLIFDLGNLIDDKYTGSFNATLTATFFTTEAETNEHPPADMIIPISAKRGEANESSHFVLPAENATNTIKFPRNINKAIFTFSGNGQAAEEFWWQNALQSDIGTFPKAGELYGLSPFREVQLLIDGYVVGAQWPFPVIFTGGVVPSLHRPIVGLQAFDLREHEIDITTWVPWLCNGDDHTFEIKVVGINNTESSPTLTEIVYDSWYVSGKVFLWLDEEGTVTRGSAPFYNYVGPIITISSHVTTQNETGLNETLTSSMTVNRLIAFTTFIMSQGRMEQVSWSQTLSYSYEGLWSNFGLSQVSKFSIQGVDIADYPTSTYNAYYTYPLFSNSTYSTSLDGGLAISAHLVQGFELQVEGRSVFPTGLEAYTNASAAGTPPYTTSYLKTHRDGTAYFFQTGDRKNSSGFGTTNQVFYFGGSEKESPLRMGLDTDELYFRNVTATNGTIVFDSERVVGVESYDFHQEVAAQNPSSSSFARVSNLVTGPKAPMGKGIVGDKPHRWPPLRVQAP